MELSLKVESSNEDADPDNGFGMSSSVLAGKGKDEKEIENSVLKSSDPKECIAPERPSSASSASNAAELQNDLQFGNDLQCKICYRFFRSMHTLAQHVRFHAVKSYKCSACSKVFSIKASFKQHICSRGHLKSFKCEICDASFMDQGSWKRHKERHFGIRNHSCDVCGMAFYEKYSLRVHQTSHFYASLKSDKDVSSGFSCHICQKYFKTKKDMKNHLVAHSTKKYSCEFCNKRFSLKYNYLRHRRIHTGDRPYKCGLCENAFSDSSSWAKHVKMHSVIKGYSCNKCGKAYYDKVSCNNHKKSCKRGKGKTKREVQSNFGKLGLEISKMSDEKANTNEDLVNEYEVSDSESQLGAEKAVFMTENEDEHYQHNVITESGFLEESVKKKSPPHDPLVTAVVENVKHDIKFQKDFVERHMPDKTFDSENEFLTSNFPVGTEMLDNDTLAFTENEVDGNDTEDQSDSNDVFPNTSKHKKMLKPHSVSHRRPRKGRRRKYFGFIPESPSKCQRCSKTFKNDNTLKKHQRVHCMLKKLYKCRYCDRQLSSNSALMRHERLHRGERPYECHLCQKCFADKSGCIRHIRVRHHLDNATKLNIFKPASDVDIMKSVNDINIIKPVCNLENKFNNVEPINKVDIGRKFTGLKQLSLIDDKSAGTGASSTESMAGSVENLSGLSLDNNGNKNNLDQVKLNYSDESRNAFNKQFEAECRAQNTSRNEQDDGFRVSEPNDIDYTVENGCWSENLAYIPEMPAFENTTEKLKTEVIENQSESEKSILDSRVNLSESEEYLLNSGANLYKCGFCGLLFDNEANCSIHISEDCSNYRALLPPVVEDNTVSKTSYSDTQVAMATASTRAVSTTASTSLLNNSSLVNKNADLKTYVAGSSSPSTSKTNKISTTQFYVSTLLSQTADLKNSRPVLQTKVSSSPQFKVSNLLTTNLKSTDTNVTIGKVSVTTEIPSLPQYKVSSLLSQTANLKTTMTEQPTLNVDRFKVIKLQQTPRNLLPNKAAQSMLTSQQQQVSTQQSQITTQIGVHQVQSAQINQQAQINTQQAQITGKAQIRQQAQINSQQTQVKCQQAQNNNQETRIPGQQVQISQQAQIYTQKAQIKCQQPQINTQQVQMKCQQPQISQQSQIIQQPQIKTQQVQIKCQQSQISQQPQINQQAQINIQHAQITSQVAQKSQQAQISQQGQLNTQQAQIKCQQPQINTQQAQIKCQQLQISQQSQINQQPQISQQAQINNQHTQITSQQLQISQQSQINQQPQISQQAQINNQHTHITSQQAQINPEQAQIGTGKPQFVQGLKEGDKVRLLLTGQQQKALLSAMRLQPSQTIQSNTGLAAKPQSGQAVSILKTNQVLNPSLGQNTLSSVASIKEQQTECINVNNNLAAVPNTRPGMDQKSQISNPSGQITLSVRPFVGGKPSSFSSKPKSFGGKPKSASNLQNKCLLCGKTFKNKSKLKQHSAIHQDRTFCCEFCIKKFHNKYGLARHVRTHTGEKPYICVVCSRGFTEKTHLEKHSKQHKPK